MLSQFRDGWNRGKLLKEMSAVALALNGDRIDIAEHRIYQAYNLLLETKLPRTLLINMITEWGLISLHLRNAGYSTLSERCKSMSDLLQARFDACDYYRDP